jgi:hypothetical protein
MASWFAGCDGPPGLTGSYKGPDRATEEEAQDDVQEHKKKYPSHKPEVYFDPTGNAEEASTFNLFTHPSMTAVDASALGLLYTSPAWVVGEEKQTRFLAELGAVAQLVVLGYQMMGKSDDPVAVGLNKFLLISDFLEGRLDAINDHFDDLKLTIEQLEIELKGYADYIALKQNFVTLNSQCKVLKSYLADPQEFNDNLGAVVVIRDQVAIFISNTLAFSTGAFTRAFAVAPAIALWAQAWTAVRRVQNPDSLKKHSVWDNSLHAGHINVFTDMFTVNKKVEANFKKVLADFGGPGAVQRFNPATGQFYDSGIPASFQYFGSDYSNLFRRALPGTLGKLLYSTKLSPGQGPGGKDLWT